MGIVSEFDSLNLQVLSVTSDLNGMRLLLEYLKPHLRNRNIDLFYISNYTPEVIQIYMNFLDGKSVDSFGILPENNLDL